MNSEQIVAKYTKRNCNGTRVRLIMAKSTKEIVDKYTKKEDNEMEKSKGLPPLLSVPKCPSPPLALGKWTLWGYECGDFPVHINAKEPCLFCLVLCKFRILFKNAVFEGKDRWENYLQKGQSFVDNSHAVPTENELGDLLPSKLAKEIFFNRKLGVAVFRDGVTPKLESAENCSGGVFQMLLFASSGQRSAPLLAKFDALFLHSLRLILDASPTIGCHVNGLFLRWQIDTANGKRKERKELDTQAAKWEEEEHEKPWDVLDLPIIGLLEIWINDQTSRKLLQKCLISAINNLIKTLEIPFNAIKQFVFRVRVSGDAYFDNKYTASLKMCSIKTFKALNP
ncbi:hypothetical protein niasHT_011714 [Heterodera trifolii]|uniref:Uncharacterized protein n=1 Tax=Heterodera trifolii TaxID=157864 RepID=A0ABD2KXP6_9BILA